MFTDHDVKCMSHALRLAKRGEFTTRPNPNVGCVIVNEQGDIVGQGYHQRAGLAHAEINALKQAGAAAKGATAYVTLEPCCHQGKTGPCTDTLIHSGIKKIFVAVRDPNPLVAGSGIDVLQKHDIDVKENLLSDQAYRLNRGFFKRMKHDLPWVTAKIASSSDGRTSLSNGSSKWISSEHSRLDVQWVRARYDAILTGIGTVLADDPSLNVRLSAQELGIDNVLQPARIIIDPELKMPLDAKMLSLEGKTIIFTSDQYDDSSLAKLSNCKVIKLKAYAGKFDLQEVLTHIANLNINSVLVEAGASLLGQLINAKLIDELIHYIAPSLMGNSANGMFNITDVSEICECTQLDYQDVRHIGRDIRITSLIKY